MAVRPSHSRASSQSNGDHRPAQPSGLRQSTSARTPHPPASDDNEQQHQHPQAPTSPGGSGIFASESTPLIPSSGSGSQRRSTVHPAHAGVCTHGTFSPRPSSPAGVPARNGDDDEEDDEGGSDTPSGTGTTIAALDSAISHIVGHDDWKRWLKKRMRTKKMGRSSELAEQAGIRDTPLMYLSYYVPCLTWMQQYRPSYIKGDLVAALTVSSFYLPMALSLAANLAHVPPINGLYSFVFNPFVYALLGSSPQMIVGPEAAGSLLVGNVVKTSVDSGGGGAEDNDVLHAQICGVVAGTSAAMVLAAGLMRLGFLDSVLSRPFLRGFISAIGFVIAVDQLIPEMGLARVVEGTGASHGSSVDKIRFIVENITQAHRMTCLVSGISFVTIMVCRSLKNRLSPRYPSVIFIPDRFLIVVASAILCWRLGWEEQGVEILGEVKAASGTPFAFRWPLQFPQIQQIRGAMSTSFLIALLGFFESSVAAKSLTGAGAIKGIELSANRELIALGVANLVGACFMSLPAFGGYGRSKVNRTAGAKSPMSGIFLSLITVLSVLFLLRYFYYLPKPVLSAMISAVAWSLIEEAPHDISFFLRIRGWRELGLMAVIFLSTIFYSLELGMALGVGVSLLMVIKHSTRPRIQILGRIPGTQRFENAEAEGAPLEYIEGSLIVKIPEPLTFANTGELKARLGRLERYGTSSAHPALPRLRSRDANRNVIFDIHGVTSIDGSGTQVLEEIVREYRERGVRVFFSRGPSRHDNPVWRQMEMSGIVALCGGEAHFVNDVEEALRWTEYEESTATGSEA